MKVKDRLVRQNEEDIIEIGRIVKTAYYGKFGEVLKAIVEGLVTEILTYHQSNPNDRMPMSAERLLGRLEGYQTIINKLEESIFQAEEAQKPIREDVEDGV